MTLAPGTPLPMARRALPYGRAEVSVNLDLASTLMAADIEDFKVKWNFNQQIWKSLDIKPPNFHHNPAQSLEKTAQFLEHSKNISTVLEKPGNQLEILHKPTKSLEKLQIIPTVLEKPGNPLENPYNLTESLEITGNTTTTTTTTKIVPNTYKTSSERVTKEGKPRLLLNWIKNNNNNNNNNEKRTKNEDNNNNNNNNNRRKRKRGVVKLLQTSITGK